VFRRYTGSKNELFAEDRKKKSFSQGEGKHSGMKEEPFKRGVKGKAENSQKNDGGVTETEKQPGENGERDVSLLPRKSRFNSRKGGTGKS